MDATPAIPVQPIHTVIHVQDVQAGVFLFAGRVGLQQKLGKKQSDQTAEGTPKMAVKK